MMPKIVRASLVTTQLPSQIRDEVEERPIREVFDLVPEASLGVGGDGWGVPEIVGHHVLRTCRNRRSVDQDVPESVSAGHGVG